MKKLFKHKEPQEVSETKQDVAEMLLQLQQQLVSLERKIDTLISQPKAMPSFQRFDRHNRFDRGRRDNNFRERRYTKAICADCGNECEVPFKPSADRPVYCNDCFAKRKSGGRDFAKARHFDKQEDRETRRHGRKSRSSFRRRKE